MDNKIFWSGEDAQANQSIETALAKVITDNPAGTAAFLLLAHNSLPSGRAYGKRESVFWIPNEIKIGLTLA